MDCVYLHSSIYKFSHWRDFACVELGLTVMFLSVSVVKFSCQYILGYSRLTMSRKQIQTPKTQGKQYDNKLTNYDWPVLFLGINLKKKENKLQCSRQLDTG